jgi:hypothetical protein
VYHGPSEIQGEISDMSEIEKMKRYIERTKISDGPKDNYCFCLGEMDEVRKYA